MKKHYSMTQTGHGHYQITLSIFYEGFDKRFSSLTTDTRGIDAVNAARWDGDDPQPLYEEHYGYLFGDAVEEWCAEIDRAIEHGAQMRRNFEGWLNEYRNESLRSFSTIEEVYDYVEDSENPFSDDSQLNEYLIEQAKKGVHNKYNEVWSAHIVQKIIDGQYTVETVSDCGCVITWGFEADGQLTPDYTHDCCYIGYVAEVDGVPVAQQMYGERFEWLVDVDSDIEGYDDAKELLMDAVGVGDFGFNMGRVPQHEEKKRKTLVAYLTGLVAQGYRLYVDPERGFANEYTSIVVEPDVEVDTTGWTKVDVEEWADGFLYRGDDATQAYTSYRLID